MARWIAAYVSSLIAGVYGVAEHPSGTGVDAAILAIAAGLGVVVSVAAGLAPAGRAARLDPVEALKKGTLQTLASGEGGRRTKVAAGLAVVAVVCLAASRDRRIFYFGYAAAIGTAILLGPLLSLGLARALRPVARWLRPVEGALASDSLIQAPRRTSATVGGLMLSVALAVAFGGIHHRSDQNGRLLVLSLCGIAERSVERLIG